MRSDWLPVPIRQLILWMVAILAVLFVFRFTNAKPLDQRAQASPVSLQLGALSEVFMTPAPLRVSWLATMQREIPELDAQTNGSLGVHVRTQNGEAYSYEAGKSRYLASTTKVPVAVVVLREVEEKRLSLNQRLSVKESDYVDGSGDIRHQKAGTKFTVRELLEKMLVESDSSATDMLIRLVGVERLNQQIQGIEKSGFGKLTTLLSVRHDAFSELHPKARDLKNTDFILLKVVPEEQKLDWLAKKLNVPKHQFQFASIEAAFENYYAKGFNSATLVAYANFLEKLVQGKLLSPTNTELLLSFMEKMKTGEKRLKAGLPIGTRFAQKTGTQVRRLCNAGVVRNSETIITVCLEKFDDPIDGERTLQRVGEIISRSGVLNTPQHQASALVLESTIHQ